MVLSDGIFRDLGKEKQPTQTTARKVWDSGACPEVEIGASSSSKHPDWHTVRVIGTRSTYKTLYIY